MTNRLGSNGRVISYIVTLFLALILISTAGLPGDSNEPVDIGEPRPAEVRSSKERVTPTSVTDSDLTELVQGHSSFAFDLYHALGNNENIFYSPYSISTALAMTYAGARGDTERQMAYTLHYLLPQETLHPAINALDMDLASRGKGGSWDESERVRLNVANSTWGQAGYPFMPDFLDTLALNYGAGMRTTDFEKAPAGSRKAINDWAAENTEGRIRDLIPRNAISEATRLVLANAVYFNARWYLAFDEALTGDYPFYLLNGDRVNTPMMSQTLDLRYGSFKTEGYQAIQLPYRGGDISMVILLPDKGEFNAFEEVLDADLVSSALQGMEYSYLDLKMPKFRIESTFKLHEVLGDMGMPNAFSKNSADFSGMDGRECAEDPECLAISSVLHRAFVSVDEEGTEAAAATTMVFELVSAGPEPQTVVIDRPFIFLIQDMETGAILFIGRVVDPRS